MLLTSPRELSALMRRGDVLVRSADGWRLAAADTDVDPAAVAQLRIEPQNDQLPGFPVDLAQTWVLAKPKRRAR